MHRFILFAVLTISSQYLQASNQSDCYAICETRECVFHQKCAKEYYFNGRRPDGCKSTCTHKETRMTYGYKYLDARLLSGICAICQGPLKHVPKKQSKHASKRSFK